MTYSTDEVYGLLPALHRVRDVEQGFPLRALIEVLAVQADVVDRDIEQLYLNWFIETCDPWVVSYIGDLLAVNPLATGSIETAAHLTALSQRFSLRSYVANTLGYRRRKGTPAVLEKVARDVTGWPARAAEFFQLVSTTQYLNHRRPASMRTPDLRRGATLRLLDGPFDQASHTAEVRPLDPGQVTAEGRTPRDRGRYNIPNVGIYLWRLQSYPVTAGTARLRTGLGGYSFSPLGLDAPLFNPDRTEDEVTHLAMEVDMPGPLSRRALFDEVEGLRQAMTDGRPAAPFLLAPSRPAFRVRFRTAASPAPFTEIGPDLVAACDLTKWGRPTATRTYRRRGGGPDHPLPIAVGIDPELGRLVFAQGLSPTEVQVSFSYGFSGNVGGGPYDQRDAARLWLSPQQVTFQRGVTQDAAAIATASDPSVLTSKLGDAVVAWNAHAAATSRPFGLITIMDSASYVEDLTAVAQVEIPKGARLAIAAAGWPDESLPGVVGPPARRPGIVALDELLRPHLKGQVLVHGSAAATDPDPGELLLCGLLIEGPLTIVPGNLGRLTLFDTTVVPGVGRISVQTLAANDQLNAALGVALDRCVAGSLNLAAPVPTLKVADSIIDGVGGPAIDAPAADAKLDRCTILGRVGVQSLEASDDAFTGQVTLQRRQQGCVRFCHVPDGSSTPRRFRCQPDLALAGIADPAVEHRIRLEMMPAFTSTVYGDPPYGQLSDTCALEIRTGASNGSEIGAFNSLLQPQREANLRAALSEYLRFRLAAGVFFVT